MSQQLTKAQWALLFDVVAAYPDEVYVQGPAIRSALMLRHHGLAKRTGGFTNACLSG